VLDNAVPTLIIFEGWDASGKGTTIAALTQRLDPRGFKLYPITALGPTSSSVRGCGGLVEGAEPRRDGHLRHSWYGRVLEERVEGTIPEKSWRQAFRDIVEFERMLAMTVR